MGVIGKRGFDRVEAGLDKTKLLELAERSGSANKESTEVRLNNASGRVAKGRKRRGKTMERGF